MPNARVATVADVVRLLERWYPPEWAEAWDAVGLVTGHPNQAVHRVLLAVDPVESVVAEALGSGAELLVTHHPLLLRPVHGVATTHPKGQVVAMLVRHGVALYVAHTNADQADPGVSDALAEALGLTGLRPLRVAQDRTGTRGLGRVGVLTESEPLSSFAERVARALPVALSGVRWAGDPDRSVRSVAVCGGAGDDLFDDARAAGVDVYVTADLRHHPASESLEHGTPALVDVSHWSSEWPWLESLAERLRPELGAHGATVDVRVSRIRTDPWTGHVATGDPR